jgi:hypothetical protein
VSVKLEDIPAFDPDEMTDEEIRLQVARDNLAKYGSTIPPDGTPPLVVVRDLGALEHESNFAALRHRFYRLSREHEELVEEVELLRELVRRYRARDSSRASSRSNAEENTA